jgi:nicotinate-nucleotide adenylyltransferase
MVRLAITEFSNLTLSDVEFSFPQPSYTITTLEYLCEKEPEVRFVLLMGADNLAFFDRWKEHQKIVSLVDLYVYPREHKNEIPAQYLDHPNIHFVDAPKLDYTATSIRKILRQGKDVKSLLPMSILNYIERNALYH